MKTIWFWQRKIRSFDNYNNSITCHESCYEIMENINKSFKVTEEGYFVDRMTEDGK